MYEINKEAFGKFLAQQRKAKGYTQKALAEELFVSDKAVSKWERSLSMPDISLLIPLSEILEVSVTELLEGRTFPKETNMEPAQVELLVKKALTFSEETLEKAKTRKKKYALLFGGSCILAILELLAGYWYLTENLSQDLLLFEGLFLLFGGYLWFFAPERLPGYYDENKISAYSHGPFRINLVGIHFNNSNWPKLLTYMRVWFTVALVVMPVLFWLIPAASKYFSFASIWMSRSLLLVFLGVLFVPMYYIGRKYQ